MFDFQKHVHLLYHLMLDDISKKNQKSAPPIQLGFTLFI